jgi:glucose-6-phosphate dehydrogenase assembly protein OpcA
VVEDGEQPFDIGETLAELNHDHPSRTIVIRLEENAGFSGRVFAQCWMPFGRRQQICCEQIEIRVSPGEIGNVPSVLRGLIAPDLPVVLWIRNPRVLRRTEIEPVLDLAHKVIVESRAFAEWRWLIAQVRRLSGRKPVADLAWTRVTRWRQLIAQIFEDKERAAHIPAIREILVRHSSPESGTAAEYLGAWAQLSIGGFPSLRFEQAGESRVWQIQQVQLEGPGLEVSIQRAERHVVEVVVNGLKTCSVFRVLKEADLLREELSVPGVDPAFRRVLDSL